LFERRTACQANPVNCRVKGVAASYSLDCVSERRYHVKTNNSAENEIKQYLDFVQDLIPLNQSYHIILKINKSS